MNDGMLVAVYGHSEVGKDTVATMIREWAAKKDWITSQSAFADAMKLVCARALGIEGDGYPDDKIRLIDEIKLRGSVSWATGRAAGHTSGRDFIIGLAEGIRDLDREFWIVYALPKHDFDLHVMTDLRFQPEADAVEAAGGYIIEVYRPNSTPRNEDRLPAHQVDRVIVNDGTLDELAASVYFTMDRLEAQDAAQRPILD